MIDFLSLVKDSGAFRIILKQKKAGNFSHAYIVECSDGEYLQEYTKILARLMLCREGDPCLSCRTCSLISNGTYADVITLPKDDEAVKTQDVNYIIEESYLKPIEGGKKIFIVNHAETMTAAAQNKLLKTLEEPPQNVHIILATTGEYSILPTVRSRAEKLRIEPFAEDKLFSVLGGELPDGEKLARAIACGDGTVSKAVSLYNDKKLVALIDLATDTIVNMQSSRDVLSYSVRIAETKEEERFFSVLQLLFRDMLFYYSGNGQAVKNRAALEKIKDAKGYSRGALVYALDKIAEYFKRKMLNANPYILTDWLLFQILEGKFKWQKS